MNQFLQMDVFFVVTTVVVILLGILACFILWRVLRILGYVEDISRDVSEESALMRSDIARVRARVREEGFKWRHISTLANSALKRFQTRRKKSE